jgi:uncharacterized protein (TIGR04141 family)
LSALVDYLKEGGSAICVAALKTHFVHVNDANCQCINTWSAFRCLYAEIPMDGKTYILRNGTWHLVNNDFMQRIDEFLKGIEIDSEKLPTYNHANEGDYNASVVDNNAAIELMDKRNIAVGGPYDKIEFCDLVRNGKDLIHVKYYRSSATLSHLFAQGSVSAETFVKYGDFRKKLNEKLPPSIRLSDPSARINPDGFRVIFAIATTKEIPRELPFFSKVTLKNAVMTLEAMSFRVALATIEVDPVLRNTKTYKPDKPKLLASAVST